jgi:hypothetical protein
MNKIFYLLILLFISSLFPNIAFTQSCNSLTATAVGYESRCASTGSIKVTATGGSSLYKYKAVGTITTNFTTSDSLTGLPAGTYSIVVNDLSTNCEYTLTGVVITGNYQDARFELSKVDVTCENGNNGSISIVNQQYGRAPYNYTIVAPSPMGVGTSNTSGVFNNLVAGDYGIRMTDSCGGVQTRRIVVNNYNWWIDSYSFTKLSCDSATGYIKVADSKGNVSTTTGIAGFQFGIVRSAGDTIWSTNPNFTFYLANKRDFQIVVKDTCGNIKTASSILNFIPAVGTTPVTYIDCNSFSMALTNVTNFFNPNFCLYNSSNLLISCNATGVFNNIPYGSYCIKAHDACTDTTITRCFSQAPPPLSVEQVAISAKTCIDFTATVTGQVGLTNPSYCIYDKTNVLLSCNTTGVFTNLSYGQYCIKIKDGCRDTTITKCFSATRPKPLISTIIDPLYITCTNFGVSVGGDSLTNPEYCLFGVGGIKLVCNSTGVFDSLPFGNYCVSIYDPCVDTTINRCFTVLPTLVTNDVAIAISNKTCTVFTATASSGNLVNPQYCLYTDANVLITCNTTGVFANLPYGGYCIKSRNSCPDTTFTTCFAVYRPIPSVNANVSYNTLTCTTFGIKINGQTNLTNPQFCLYDNSNVQLSCNTTGTFTNLPYGSYCVKIVNTCYDTTIVRCFTKVLAPLAMSIYTDLSCSYGYGYLDINLTGTNLPVNITIIRPNGNVFLNKNYSNNYIFVDSLPTTATGQTYKIIATDFCGKKDSTTFSVVASYFTHVPTVINKCPSATASNGSGDIQVAGATNMGTIQVRITKRNGVSYSPSLSPNTSSGGLYIFKDLSPGVYILRYREGYCKVNIFDTVTIKTYTFPNLNKSSAYQCDVNGFSVGAVATNGVAPYSYEIIGSTPAIPAINTPAQSSPIFNVNNGSTYSLIRLRAIDACGNGTLNDASILPLANTTITSSLNCFAGPTTLGVDSIYNSTYLWYKKEKITSTDSIYIGTGLSYYIPDLSPLDTGVYVCKIVVNGGCITRVNNITVNGQCNSLLPTVLKEFSGNFNANTIDLNWVTTQENKLHHFTIEKLINNQFTTIGTRNAVGNAAIENSYTFIDTKPLDGTNTYRIKLEHTDGKFVYSNIVNLKKTGSSWATVFPNPVQDKINVQIQSNKAVKANLVLYDAQGKMVYTNIAKLNQGFNSISIAATNMAAGLYNLNIQLPTGEVITQRIIKQ